MSEYFEFSIPWRCTECGSRNVEYVEFEIYNRMDRATAKERSVECFDCYKHSIIQPELIVALEANERPEPAKETPE